MKSLRFRQCGLFPLITSTLQASIIDGVNYTDLLNGIFFMLTALGSVALIAQAIPMLFFKFDENAIEDELNEYRKAKEEALEKELSEAAEA